MKAREMDLSELTPLNSAIPIDLNHSIFSFYQLNFHVRFCLKKEFSTKKGYKKFEKLSYTKLHLEE